jgi:uncharacterized DUF497 family protein
VAPNPIVVEAFEWDDRNIPHAGEHGLTSAIAMEVRSDAPLFFRNKVGRTGSHMMIGHDESQKFWTVILLPTSTEGLWRPITGFESSRQERRRYEEAQGGNALNRG